ncbi:MAG: carbohydrate ABC transporter permease [Nodosilinea sp. LVE1205-7]|jgi:putative chitobiose transport system permease protein
MAITIAIALRERFLRWRYWRTLLLYLVLLTIAVMMLFPMLWLLSTSLKGPGENLLASPPQLIPSSFTLANYYKVWQTNPLGKYFVNSTVVAGLTVLLNLLICSLAAYPLARLEFAGRDLILALIVATIMIPFQVVMIPLYILAVNLGLRNTYLGLVLPYLASAFGIFLMRQAFQTVPKELEEAARLDGCSDLGVWWNVMIPATQPALVTLGIFVFIGTWSEFLWPLILLDRPERYTLPLGVAQLSGSFSLDWRLIAAGSILSVLPAVLVFILLQRYIIPSQTASGIKG